MVSERRIADAFWDLRDDAFDHPDAWEGVRAEVIFQQLAQRVEDAEERGEPLDLSRIAQQLVDWRTEVTSGMPRAAYATGRATPAISSGVLSRDQFAEFVLRVLADFRTTGASEWTNSTLEQFLDGLSAFALARVHNQAGQDEPSWQLFAEIIHAATGYE